MHSSRVFSSLLEPSRTWHALFYQYWDGSLEPSLLLQLCSFLRLAPSQDGSCEPKMRILCIHSPAPCLTQFSNNWLLRWSVCDESQQLSQEWVWPRSGPGLALVWPWSGPGLADMPYQINSGIRYCAFCLLIDKILCIVHAANCTLTVGRVYIARQSMYT